MPKDAFQLAADDQSVGSLGRTGPVSPTSNGTDDIPEERRRWRRHSKNDLPEIREEDRSVQLHGVMMLCLLIVIGLILSISPAVIASKTDDDDDDDGLRNSIVSASCFIVLLMVFMKYDSMVRKRHSALVKITKRSKGIVDQLFPSAVRDRLLRGDFSQRSSEDGNQNSEHGLTMDELTKRNTLRNQATRDSDGKRPSPVKLSSISQISMAGSLRRSEVALEKNVVNTEDEEAIAELYQETTVFFADIAGFTAWSAQRSPREVFKLLETVYHEFDEIAASLRVFKVETIGDSYMAVTGLPEPDDDHAINMARFAYQCILRMTKVTQELEAVLGPGTSSLGIRCGMHSGSVTGGVLRGQKSRFQLFGDTVNTASRMESTGESGKVQISQETADELITKGKVHWLRPRETKVTAKGKGEMITYWLEPRKKPQHYNPSPSPILVGSAIESVGPEAMMTDRSNPSLPSSDQKPIGHSTQKSNQSTIVFSKEQRDRLIEFNTDVLLKPLLQSMSVRLTSKGAKTKSVRKIDHSAETFEPLFAASAVSDSIPFPDFDPRKKTDGLIGDDTKEIRSDLRDYIAEIASLYNNVPFHNFEHASHVILATDKLMQIMFNQKRVPASELYKMTYGISSDPLTHFAMVFAALVHDVGHGGIPNAVLVKEGARLALLYDNDSVAEQHSLSLAWKTLLKPRYQNLRACIYETNVERKHFRQILVNAVMATDIADRSLLQMRADKWSRLFPVDPNARERPSKERLNERATALSETIIQVANVSHTMQHWTIYRKWNEKLFQEMRAAHEAGRGLDPAQHWYRGEMAFYDNYVIPLAMRLLESGVYSNQYLKFAKKNRAEWQATGEAVVETMKASGEEVVEEGELDDDDSILEGASNVTGDVRRASVASTLGCRDSFHSGNLL